ncbi:phage tail tape measure protein, TP901 family [Streptococcus pasteurianus]|uniref:phage tail tape measure protein n=1 Tax=Streptococcus pasteurianus TaxID=197614 RepID=UPI00076FBE6B|nr:phage tail tape measure protein [Streptococcus pasteurianus]KXI12231.1 phage tail tape measure protein, TP901 family [Streptococcus pasteurianus]
MNLGELVATATLDIAPFQTNTKQLKTYLRGVDSSLKAVEKSISGQGNKVKALRSVYNETGQALKGYQALLVKQTENYNTLKSNIGDVASATEKQKNQLLGARTAMMDTAAKISELQGRLQSLATEINIFSRMGSAMTNFGDKLTTLGSGAVNLGSTLTGAITTPLVGIGVAAMTTFGNFEQQMNRVKAISGATGGQFDQLKQRAVELGASSVFSASEVAQAMENMASAGMNVNDIYSASAGVMDLAAVSGRDMGLAAEAVASAMNQFGIAGENATHVADVYAKAAADTNAETVDMAEAMKYAGPVMSSLNSSFEETAAAIGIMSNAGIKGSQAGTTLRTAMQRLAAPTDVAAKLMESLGISAYNSEGQMKPISELLPHLQERLSGLSEEQRNNALNTLFGKESLSGMLALLDSAGPEFDGVVSGLQNSNGAAKEMADTMNSGLSGSIENLKGKLETAAITVSERFAPYIEQLADKVGELTEWFTNLSEEQQDQIIKWGLVAAAAGPALVVFGKVAGTLGTTFKALGTVSSGIGKLVGKVAPLITNFAGMETAAVGATGATSGLGTSISLLSNPLGVVVGGAALLTGGLVVLAEAKERARESAEKYGTTLSNDTKGKLDEFSSAVTTAQTAMTNFETGATQSADNVKQAVADMMSAITQGAEDSKARIDVLAQKYGLTDEQVAAAKAKQDLIVSNSQTMTDQITAIYEKHNGDVSRLTTTEKTIVENNMRELCKARVQELGLGKDKEKAILEVFNGDVKNMTMAQLKDQSSALQEAMKEEQQSYKTQRDEIKESLDLGLIDQEQYNSKMAALKTQHNATMTEFGQALTKVAQEQDAQSGQFGVYAEKIRQVLEDYDMSFEDLSKQALESANQIGQNTAMIGTYTSDMSADAKSATDQWNALTLDPLTGELKTNATQEVANALTAENGWNNMEFILKNANVNSNARVEVADALQKLGEWDNTTPEQKELLFQNDKGLLAIYESKEQLDIWNGMPANVKELLGENEKFTSSAKTAQEMLDKWNNATPDQKELIASNQTSEGVSAAIDMLLTVPDEKKTDVKAENNTAQGAADAKATVDSISQGSPIGVFALDMTGSQTASAQSKIDNTQQKSPASLKAQNDTGDGTSKAQAAIDKVMQRAPIAIRAVDNATTTVRSIVGGFPAFHTIKVVAEAAGSLINKIFKNEKGTNFHPGGLALVNDQKGPTYRELVTLPDGTSFIPQGRNVMLPLPRGSKVLPAGKTKQLFPRYANGIGFENTRVADVARRIGNLQSQSDTVVLTDHGDNSNINQALNKLIELVAENTDSLDKLAARQIIIENYMDTERVGRSVAKSVTSEQERQESIKNAVYGMGW